MVVVAFYCGTSSWQEQVCENAKNLLEDSEVPFILTNVLDESIQIRSALHMLSGSLVYPQFFWTDQKNDVIFLGGFETLKEAIAGDGSNTAPTIKLVQPYNDNATKRTNQKTFPYASLKTMRQHLVRQASEAKLEQTNPDGGTLPAEPAPGKRTQPRRLQKSASAEQEKNDFVATPCPSSIGTSPLNCYEKRPFHQAPLKYLRRSFVRQYSSDRYEAHAALPPDFITDEEPRPSIVVYPNDKRPEDIATTRPTVRFLVASLESGVDKGILTSFSTKQYLDHCRNLSQQSTKGLEPSLKVSPPQATTKENFVFPAYLRPSLYRGSSLDDDDDDPDQENADSSSTSRGILSKLRPSMIRGGSFEEDNKELQSSISITDLVSTPTTEQHSFSDEHDHNENFFVHSNPRKIDVSPTHSARRRLSRQDSFGESDFVQESGSSLNSQDLPSKRTALTSQELLEDDDLFETSTGSLSVDDLPPARPKGNPIHHPKKYVTLGSLNAGNSTLPSKYFVPDAVDSFNVSCYSNSRGCEDDETATITGTSSFGLRPSTIRGTSFDDDIHTSDDVGYTPGLGYQSSSLLQPEPSNVSTLRPAAARGSSFDNDGDERFDETEANQSSKKPDQLRKNSAPIQSYGNLESTSDEKIDLNPSRQQRDIIFAERTPENSSNRQEDPFLEMEKIKLNKIVSSVEGCLNPEGKCDHRADEEVKGEAALGDSPVPPKKKIFSVATGPSWLYKAVT